MLNLAPDQVSLDAKERTPSAIWAIKDPNSGNLDRVQVIKIWEEVRQAEGEGVRCRLAR